MGPYNLENAIAKLRWSSTGEWSASLLPAECRALLDELESVQRPGRGTLDVRGPALETKEWRRPPDVVAPLRVEVNGNLYMPVPKLPEPYQGDPGDEHHDPR